MAAASIGSKDNEKSKVVLPEPLNNGALERTYTIKEFPEAKDLASVLLDIGVDTTSWGTGDTKDVSKFWKEMKLSEAGLEVWRTASGERKAIRVTHVLRAKVSSVDAYSQSIFLFNTWQQYGDGRKRTRNGLLSEKLSLDEMPLEANLHQVCRRAVTEEEMQRVVDSSVRIGHGRPAPAYDPDYECPIEVVYEEFVDHTIEIEESKSYPGLLTAYHLYTVDIVCAGLPPVDFNTLEFEAPDKDGNRKLKYIHAWVWLDWGKIQRYLFDGSKMKERKSKASFSSHAELESWLSQFDVDLASWGSGQWKSCEKLWIELEECRSQLERWGRNDGVPLLMRTVHVLQLKVCSVDAKDGSKFLFQMWEQNDRETIQHVNRTMSTKLSTAKLPFDAAAFDQAARELISKELSMLTDVHVRLGEADCPTRMPSGKSPVEVVSVNFSDHRHDLEHSPSFKDLTTMYHLYTVEVMCKGLPSSDFASIAYDKRGKPQVLGWHWVSWQEALDLLRRRTQSLEQLESARNSQLAAASLACQTCLRDVAVADLTPEASDFFRAQLEEVLKQLNPEAAARPRTRRLSYISPAMVSSFADQKGVSDEFLDRMASERGGSKDPLHAVACEEAARGSQTLKNSSEVVMNDDEIDATQMTTTNKSWLDWPCCNTKPESDRSFATILH